MKRFYMRAIAVLSTLAALFVASGATAQWR